jgi:hypothetical protein
MDRRPVYRGDNSLVGPRKALGGGSGLVARNQLGELGLIAFRSGGPADPSHTVICNQPVVETPTLAIPSEPLAQAGDIPQRVLVLVDKAQCQGIVAESWRPEFPLLVTLVAEPDDICLG